MPEVEPTFSAPPRLLVSVRGPDEALTALQAGADLIDAKDPERGALGALPPETVRAIAACIGDQAVTSAVAGDGTGTEIAAAVAMIAATGVDFIRAGSSACSSPRTALRWTSPPGSLPQAFAGR